MRRFESFLSGRVGVKRFQTTPSIRCRMFTRRVLASLRDRHLGLPMMGSGGCGGPISRRVLAVRLTAGIRIRNGLASSIVPAGDITPPVGGIHVSPVVLRHKCALTARSRRSSPGHAAAASSLVQRNSVPSTHMRCMMTASRRATATIARFIPRCRAIFMPQALSHDHLRL